VKYVALLALNRIVTTHPMLVSVQQDVIMDCLDDADVSIRLQALELVTGIVTSDTLQTVVNRLVDQLQLASLSISMDALDPEADPSARPGSESPGEQKASNVGPDTSIDLPSEYRTEVVNRVLDICSQSNYAEVIDFEWYVGILVKLVGLLPPSGLDEYWQQPQAGQWPINGSRTTVAFRIGSEIRNVAVRVRGVRPEATRAAESLLLLDNRPILFPTGSNIGNDVLGPVAWVVGEYAECLVSPDRALQSLIDPSNASLAPRTLQLFLQAIPKVFVQLSRTWGAKGTWKSELSLLLARVVDFLELLAAHPDLDVQERAIEFLEVLRLGAEAMRSDTQEVPFLLASVIPSLFEGLELNPVALSAQKKVILPPSLRLDEAFHDDLPGLFRSVDRSMLDVDRRSVLRDFYHVPELSPPVNKPVYESAPVEMHFGPSYQNTLGGPVEPPSVLERRKYERRERFRDDPFYIAPGGSSGTSTPLHDVFRSTNGDALDIDSIPIVDLKLDDGPQGRVDHDSLTSRRISPKKMEVAADETFGSDDTPLQDSLAGVTGGSTGSRRSLLQVDSSGLGQLSLGKDDDRDPVVAGEEGDAEMRKAMQNVEQMRLRMQRASERIQLEGSPAEGTLVKKKKKKSKKPEDGDVEKTGPSRPRVKKKKKREAA
jgi:AP-3 complex subunit delta-1